MLFLAFHLAELPFTILLEPLLVFGAESAAGRFLGLNPPHGRVAEHALLHLLHHGHAVASSPASHGLHHGGHNTELLDQAADQIGRNSGTLGNAVATQRIDLLGVAALDRKSVG